MNSKWRFLLKDLGPVEEADLELGNLTLIAGRNNTGKTYMVYALQGFLQFFDALAIKTMEIWSIRGFFSDAIRLNDSFLAGELLEAGIVKLKVDRDGLDNDRASLFQDSAKLYSQSYLDTVFGAPQGTFETATFDVEADWGAHEYSSTAIWLSRGVELSVSYNEDEFSFTLNWLDGEGRTNIRHQLTQVENGLRRAYIRFLTQGDDVFGNNLHCTTAARFSVSLLHKDLESKRRSIVRALHQERPMQLEDGSIWVPADAIMDASRYALPIENEIDFVKNIPADFPAPPRYVEVSPFSNIVEMMGGHYTKVEDEIFFNSSEESHRQFRIPLHLASSSVVELSNLYFYLAMGRKRDNPVLIIDEPESHLDPINQIEFARALARWTNSGIRVLISTHSDYIVKEINNLIMLHSDFEDKEEVVGRLGYTESLDPETVRAYVADNGVLGECDIDKYGIEMPYFDYTIDRINAVSNELTGRLSAEEDQ